MSRPVPAVDPAPAELDDVLDPGWLTAALADVAPGERVVEVDQIARTQTLAHKVRFAAVIEGLDGERRTRVYCVKAHFGDGSPETLLTETHVYRDLHPILDVRTPRAFYAGIDESKGRSLIIMDDVESEGGRFLSARESYWEATCQDALGQLARLHAATWDDPRWDVDWLGSRMVMTAGLFPTDALQRLLDDGRGEQVAPELLDARRLQQAVAVTASLPPTCVTHGDTHSGNVYLDAAGRACWLDWQVTQRGHWSIDVSYHIATALDIEDRRSHERDLLGGYLEELAALGVEPPSWDEAWERYSLGFSWGFLLWAITRISSREVVLIHMPRLGAALSDHDTFARLEARSSSAPPTRTG
jgi:aminoglycoside phosphotransferase (APT) family kinase protein